MAIAPAPSAPSTAAPAFRRTPAAPTDNIWRAPLVPVALALTLGMVADRYAGLPWPVSVAFGVVSAVAGMVVLAGGQKPLAWLYLMGVVATIAALRHHAQRNLFPADDIGYLAPLDPRPARLRGILLEEPIVILHPPADPMKSFSRPDPTRTVLEVSQMHNRWDWQPVSGKVQVTVEGKLPDLHVGDQVEIVGRLSQPQPPANPGEADYASFLLDQRIRAVLRVAKAPEGVTLLEEGSPWSLDRTLVLIRGWGCRTLKEALPKEYFGVAAALLLGEDSLMMSRDWDKYKVTGVIHALAISGQHLTILAGFLWVVFRILRVPRRAGAWFVALFVIAYALLTGARPPAVRAAVMVSVVCFGIILRRPVLRANSVALAWIIIGLLNPTDLFTPGCLLSFLGVAILYWGAEPWFRTRPEQRDLLSEEKQTFSAWVFRKGGSFILFAYGITWFLWPAAAPLVATHYNAVPWAALLIGPPVVFSAAIALITGFLLLLTNGSVIFVKATTLFLAGCDGPVDWAYSIPATHQFIPGIPAWWLWVFYMGFFAVLLLAPLRQHWRWGLLAGLTWLCLGLLVGWLRPIPEELRCTFLAVGHGGCAVLETPDGRTLLYDTGTIAGPDLARRQVAPYLWSRGIRRIDEVFISHADLDHFNGLLDLADRFSIGQVTLTPTFDKKDIRAVKLTLKGDEERGIKGLKQRGIPIRQVQAGQVLHAGEVVLQVLHPPMKGPEGKENYRSLVLLVRHERHTILLTGDLEGPGMEQVLKLPLPRIDVLMAPHHGSRAANTPALVRKVRPRVVVACLGPPRGATRPADPAMTGGVPFLGTWPQGAVTIISRRGRLTAETFVTGQRLLLATR